MSRTCIICGVLASSREHLFPAALGGRRTNKGIYCHDHNNAYGPVLEPLVAQLAFFNAQLDVVGDRGKAVRPVRLVEKETGRTVLVTGSSLRVKGPALMHVEMNEDGPLRTVTAFDQAQADRAVAEAKVRGEPLHRVVRAAHHVGALHGSMSFGGPEGLRAITYVAQTHFAQAFPDLVRTDAFALLKDYTLNGNGPPLAWWCFAPMEELGANRFAFGHRIVVGVDASSAEAFAHVSLFSTLHFNILLGSVRGEPSRTRVTDIDPLAPHPPHDRVEWDTAALVDVPRHPPDPVAALRFAMESGQAASAVNELMARIQAHRLEMEALPFLNGLLTMASVVEDERVMRIAERLRRHERRIVFLMEHVVDGLLQDSAGPLKEAMAEMLSPVVVRNPYRPSGLAPETERMARVCTRALAKQLDRELMSGTLTLERVVALLGHGVGAAIVGHAMFTDILGDGLLDPLVV